MPATSPELEPVVFLKLGGSLITDKERPDTARPEVIRRLAAEIARAQARPGARRLVLGHGSGSFGHAAAARLGVARGLDSGRLAAVSQVQERARALHRLVADALREAGLAPFSLAPSASLVTDVGRPVAFGVEPVALALDWGLLPVLYGDVVLDRFRGCSICSTESVLITVAERLARRRVRVERALWAGATDGILDSSGKTLRALGPETAAQALAAAGEAAGTDVTGGMRHRLETALALAEKGTPSLVFDGTVPGRVEAALAGEEAGGTMISPAL